MSDRASKGVYQDLSGPIIVEVPATRPLRAARSLRSARARVSESPSLLP